MKALRPAVAVAAVLLAPAAFAGPKCTDAPRSQWLPEHAMQERITAAGYTIDKFKVSGSCYEIYGRDKDRRRVEIYYDPTDGRVVKQRGDE
ncbi:MULTISPECIES: PepSY domain-containing protein [unclassified Luteimonas]|uniref:PepSY domain-containing protein n=1 Tax=unclassified Luteimonas TaxID=2629088 RepID=UPI0018F0A470|nr:MULTISPECIES: PepSY domain-containing protein [unclassified Luteimonas]MBJ6980561.1 PepSY domain-containing protein [Luteimonas sp. MC1572]MBJ7574175.1 PepSY domain-containing protein [Luteimonas sp. MC1828]QQO04429.1 PepSY domain-containing protein [Luteimonas sp. MC1572]